MSLVNIGVRCQWCEILCLIDDVVIAGRSIVEGQIRRGTYHIGAWGTDRAQAERVGYVHDPGP